MSSACYRILTDMFNNYGNSAVNNVLHCGCKVGARLESDPAGFPFSLLTHQVVPFPFFPTRFSLFPGRKGLSKGGLSFFAARVHENYEVVLGPVICMPSRRSPFFVGRQFMTVTKRRERPCSADSLEKTVWAPSGPMGPNGAGALSRALPGLRPYR